MSKKLLSEEVVRRFAKLANIQNLNEMYQNEEKEEMMQEEEMPMDAAEEVEMDAEEEVEGELPVPAQEEGMEDSEAIARQVIDAVAGALRDTLNVDIEVEGSAEETEVEMGEEEPEMEMPEPEMEMGEEETEVMEALSEIEYVPSQQEIVEEVARRVAKRLLKAKKAQADLNEALGLKK